MKKKMKILKRKRLGLFFLLSISLTWNAGVWGEEFSSDNFGGNGGTRNYNLDCGPSGIMTGAMSKSSQFLDQLMVICRNVNPSTGVLGEEYTRGPVGGMGGSRDKIERCRNGRVVTRIEAQHGSFINGMVLGCETWLEDRRQPLQTPGRIEDALRLGSICNEAMFGANCRFPKFRCPGSRVTKALRGKYGIYIDSIRFVCDDWDK